MDYSGMDMRGKVCLVTGATNGIGRVTALELAKLGAQVVIVARSQERGQAVLDAIRNQTGNDSAEMLLADLSDQAQVRKLAADFKARHDRLHVLINNAGVLNFRRRQTVNGLEMTMAVNHAAYYLLTHGLRDLIVASAPARIINVASDAHYRGVIDFNNLQSKGPYWGMRTYSNSKLMNVMYTYALARRTAGTGVSANVVHPGLVATGFAHNNGPLVSLGMRLIMAPISLTPEKGADTLIWLAASPEVEGVSGKYWYQRQALRSLETSYDEAAQERLWQATKELVGGDPAA